MPNSWLSIDTGFPSFTGKESPSEQIKALHDYLYQMRQGLQYSLANLTMDNFNATALEQMDQGQKDQLEQELRKVYTRLDQVSAKLDQLSASVNGLQGLSGRVDTAEDDIDALEEWTGAAELQLEDIQSRLDTPEDGGTDERVETLEGQVSGEGGLMERVGTLEESQKATEEHLQKLSGVTNVAEDGSVTIGNEASVLHLVGQIYINGVLYGGEDTT